MEKEKCEGCKHFQDGKPPLCTQGHWWPVSLIIKCQREEEKEGGE